MGDRLTIGSVLGVEIRIHRSWLLIALLIMWSFWTRFSTDDTTATTGLGLALAATVLFFGSVLAHELAHSLEARHRGVEVSGITLFLFGGATETAFDVDRPRDEFALTAVGPFTSFVLGAAFGLVATYSRAAGIPDLPRLAGDLAWINLALGVFNLLPGAPLDGGRILRSAVWAVTGDRGRAVRVAARAGQLLGAMLFGLGLFQLFFVPGGLIGGIWLAFIGWFLGSAAGAEHAQRQLEEQLGGTTIGQLVRGAELPTIGADADLEQAAARLHERPEDALTVTGDDGAVGLLTLDDVAAVAADRRSQLRAADVATPVDRLDRTPADTPVTEALRRLRGDRPVAVTDDATVRGIVTPERLQRAVRRTVQLGAPSADRDEPDAHQHVPGGDQG